MSHCRRLAPWEGDGVADGGRVTPARPCYQQGRTAGTSSIGRSPLKLEQLMLGEVQRRAALGVAGIAACWGFIGVLVRWVDLPAGGHRLQPLHAGRGDARACSSASATSGARRGPPPDRSRAAAKAPRWGLVLLGVGAGRALAAAGGRAAAGAARHGAAHHLPRAGDRHLPRPAPPARAGARPHLPRGRARVGRHRRARASGRRLRRRGGARPRRGMHLRVAHAVLEAGGQRRRR